VLVKARDVTLSRVSYSFHCPSCRTPVRQPATRRETELLAAQGALIFVDARPALTMDDVITLHELLQDDDWMQALLNAPALGTPGVAGHDLRPLPDRRDG
jgi:hypothetical protein